MIYRNPEILNIINLSTRELKGWDERRGNYRETYLDRWDFAENMINKCIQIILEDKSDEQSGKKYADLLKKYFGM